jgi:Ni,Fe-hydrogenase I large subunit
MKTQISTHGLGHTGGERMPKITIDPVTRIEGHLRIEAQIEGGKVVDAWSSSTMWRGLEVIAKDRDPRDIWLLMSRI